MIRATLNLSAIYLIAIGAGLMFFPFQFGVGAVPADASPELIALLRLLGGPFLGIAALNLMSRNSPPGAALHPVLVANLIGFGAVAANDIIGVATGQSRDLAKYFLIAHLLFAGAFALAIRVNLKGQP